MQFDLQYDPAVITPTGIIPAGVYKTNYTDGFELVYNVPSPGDLLITMGAGDVLRFGERFLAPEGGPS